MNWKIRKLPYFCEPKTICMAKNLVIVESPAKAKTIEKFLGKDFKVTSSFGHIADLPSKELGVDVDKDFAPKYVVDKDKKARIIRTAFGADRYGGGYTVCQV